MLNIVVLSCLSSVLFALTPRVAIALVSRSERRFGLWFDEGRLAFTKGVSAKELKIGKSWQQEVKRLASEGLLSTEQLAKANCLFSEPLLVKQGPAPYRKASKQVNASVGIIFASIGAVIAQIACNLAFDPIVAAMVCIIVASGLCLAVSDVLARIIPNMLVCVLGVLGTILQVACGNTEEIIVLALVALSTMAVACTINVFFAHRHKNECAIGFGDIKSLIAIVLCCGIRGLLVSWIALVIALLFHASFHCLKYQKLGKLPLGPALSLALSVGVFSCVVQSVR